ncbi:protein HtrL-like [Haliotis cracherodii]|uniref:protein HtrL-like n=1 Tax=Haliotis cracherodii TaxID=6455 RepID=UPI0039E848AB
MSEFGNIMTIKHNWRRCLKIFVGCLLAIVCVKFSVQPPCILGFVPLRTFPSFEGDVRVPPDITVVTAYLNLGRFNKGDGGTVFGPTLYLEWATVYKHLMNPLVVYTDSDQFVRLFTDMRQHLMNITKIIKIEKKQLWAFDHLDKVRDIYSNPNYPKYQPNTVVPEYPCVQNAKYACVEKAIESDVFHTKYYMWVDVGYFRLITSRKRDFRLTLPRDFDEKKIAFNQVNLDYSMEELPEDIFKNMYVWVGGGLVVAERDVFRQFVKEYRRAVEHYLDLKLSNSDQQVLFAMSTKAERVKLRLTVDIQPYVWDVWGSCWYYLGYQCYREL